MPSKLLREGVLSGYSVGAHLHQYPSSAPRPCAERCPLLCLLHPRGGRLDLCKGQIAVIGVTAGYVDERAFAGFAHDDFAVAAIAIEGGPADAPAGHAPGNGDIDRDDSCGRVERFWHTESSIMSRTPSHPASSIVSEDTQLDRITFHSQQGKSGKGFISFCCLMETTAGQTTSVLRAGICRGPLQERGVHPAGHRHRCCHTSATPWPTPGQGVAAGAGQAPLAALRARLAREG